MKIKTEIDFWDGATEESYTDKVVLERTVADLDVYDFIWYLMKLCEMAGYDVKDVKLVMNDGKLFETDF